MSKSFIIIFSLLCSSIAFAVPRENYLASPQSIEVSGDKVKLSFLLPCKNKHPEEWAGNLIGVSDDEGDMVVGLGVILSKASCEAGPKKLFVFEYSLNETGLSKSDLENGASFEPIDLAQ